MTTLQCYMCPEFATSDEHAPPRCLFPERKDTPDGRDHRKNLITVPSCEAHNSAKSKDDEYFLHVLAGSYTSSQIGLTQFTTKVGRAFDRAPSKASKFSENSAPVFLRRLEQSEWEDGAQIIVQGDRIDAVLSNCARALYFRETGKRFTGPAIVLTGFTRYTDKRIQSSVSAGLAATENYFGRQAAKGENPEVFWYKFEEGKRTAIFLLAFYSHSKAMVRFEKLA